MHEEVRRVIDALERKQAIDGYDPFGFRPEILERLLPPTHFLYRKYFRVDTYGMEHIPEGRVLLIANHSGQLPFDGAMIGTSLLMELDPPRIIRSMVERWVPHLPFISMFFSRAGQVTGTRENARRLLRDGNAILVFPEGSRGISKTFDRRYRLEPFGLGFMRLALETGTPIIPIGVVGAEEQLPSIYNAKQVARLLNMPALPVCPNLIFPLPVKYRIYFGQPMTFEGDHDDEDRVIRDKVDRVTNAIDGLLQRGLSERPSIFY